MNFGLKTKLQKITALLLVLVTVISLLWIGDSTTYAYDEKAGMIASADRYTVETKDQPSEEGTRVSGLVYGKPLTVIDEVTGEDGVKWYQIKYFISDGAVEKTAYCKAEDVLLDENAYVIGTGKTNANNVILWSAPGTYKKPEILTLNLGTKVDIMDEHVSAGQSWYRVRYKTEEKTYFGWIEKTYIAKDAIPEIETDEEYVDYLMRIGFPETYARNLAVLHEQYPNWVFEPVMVGLTWAEVIENESKAGRNLIETNRNDAMKSYADSEYNWYTNEWVIRDSTRWVTVHPDYIAYCMDPRNWFNETNIFMFESLSYSETHNLEGVTAILKNTFMAQEISNGDAEGTMLNYANAFMEIAQALNVSPYHLASRVKQEQGKGTSPLISGTYEGYEGYYNYFNHGAYGTPNSVLYANGLSYAKKKGWDTRYKSLYGGSEIIAKNYISVGQDTLYFQKFDVIAQGGLYNHQYMTNVEAAISESKSVAKAYEDKQQKFVFKIPVYENMPEEPAQFTASGNRNNYLKTLEVKEQSLTPTFDGAKTTYSLIVENDVTSITVSATPVVDKATVEGTGTLKLKEGTNTFSIICKSESGDKKTYTLTVIREAAGENPPADDPNENPEVPPSETPDVPPSEDTEVPPSEDTEVPPSETPEPSYTTEKYVLDTYITGVEPQTTVADFLAGFKAENCTLKVFTAAGAEHTGIVATGNKLAMYVDDELVETKEIVIYGDVSGDGKINALDAIKVNRYTIGTTSLTGCYLVAGDVSKDGKTNALDAIIINRYTIGLSEIKQR